MSKFTITADYFATGEGRTMTIMYLFAEDSIKALEEFKKQIHNGEWWVLGADVVEGFDFDNEMAKFMITAGVRSQLEDDHCNLNYFSQLHFNYS